VKMAGLWPLTSGGRIRSFQIVSQLSQLHSVSVITTCEPAAPGVAPPAAQRDTLRAALPACGSVVALPHAPARVGSPRFALALSRSWLSPLPVDLHRWRVPSLQREIERSLSDGAFDLCVADFLAAVPNLPARPGVPVILFEHNVEHLIWRRLARTLSPGRRAPAELEWRKLRRYEARACSGAALTVAVSEDDAAVLRSIAPGADVRPISTGVDVEYFSQNGPREISGRIAFVGSMDWYPNQDAALFLIEQIMPRVRAARPDATLAIVGRKPSARVRAAATRIGAEVTGTVDDVRPHIARAQVVVVPLRVGSGTRLKIFEALAMGKAVVSTAVGAEGLPIVPSEHYLRRDEPVAFADAVTSLLGDPARRRALGSAGRNLVAERYAWSQIALQFAALCDLARGRSGRI